jgi:hypothetical protein
MAANVLFYTIASRLMGEHYAPRTDPVLLIGQGGRQGSLRAGTAVGSMPAAKHAGLLAQVATDTASTLLSVGGPKGQPKYSQGEALASDRFSSSVQPRISCQLWLPVIESANSASGSL